MPLFTANTAAVQQPGVFLIEVAAPTVIDGVAGGYVGLAFQGEWGPVQTLYIPTSGGDMMNTYFPAGSAHTSTGYYAVMRRKATPWAMVRVLGTGYASATYNLQDAVPANVMLLTAKYPGTLGNSITATVAAATDGVANHFNLTVTLTNATTGSTTETYTNLQTIAPAILPVLTSSNLLASATLVGTPTTRPVNGTFTLAGGSAGAAVGAADYNTAFTQLATSGLIRVKCVDDCGDTIRAAVNAFLQASVDATTNCMAVLQGSPTNALAAAITDVATYRDDRVIYCGSWVNVLDDNGTVQQSPFSTFVASAIVNLEPQQSHAWWDDRVTTYYNGIASIPNTILNTNDDGTKNQCTTNGICLPVRLDSGKYAALHDRTTSLTTSKLFSVTRRLKDYYGLSIKAGIPGWVNGPNTGDQQRALKITIDDFMNREQIKGRNTGYTIDTKSGNTASSIALGQFVVIVNATTPAPMEKIFIMMNVGPTVVIAVQ